VFEGKNSQLATELLMFRLLPVPMHLDDPRWHRSWWRKPCQVVHASEQQARAAAALYFATADGQIIASSPWDDPELVHCEASTSAPLDDTLTPGAVLDLGSQRIRQDHS
jgi:hypothetical protein